MSSTKLPEWDRVLSAAAHLQTILPDAVLVGGSASAVYAAHRMSVDADHVVTDLRSRFDAVLAELEPVAGWKTARIQRPVQILGKLDGIETGIRQLIRETPLETQRKNISVQGVPIEITLPTPAEMLRIKAVLILKRTSPAITLISPHCQTDSARTTRAPHSQRSTRFIRKPMANRQ